jgi:hypothetical protein
MVYLWNCNVIQLLNNQKVHNDTVTNEKCPLKNVELNTRFDTGSEGTEPRDLHALSSYAASSRNIQLSCELGIFLYWAELWQ